MVVVEKNQVTNCDSCNNYKKIEKSKMCKNNSS